MGVLCANPNSQISAWLEIEFNIFNDENLQVIQNCNLIIEFHKLYDNKLHKNDFWSKKRLAMQTDINGETYSYEFSNFRFKI